MAIFNLRCSDECGNTKKVFSDSFSLINLIQKTCRCGKIMHRDTNPPSTSVMERLDNGAMAKTLARYSDAERLFQERHDNADELAGTKPNRS